MSHPPLEIFRDYGFVESFPQHWHYYNFNDMEFELHQLDGFYYVEWMKEPTENQAMQWYQWLQQEYRRLTRFWYHESNNQNSIPKNEWDMTWNFHHSNVVAIKCAIHALEGKNMSISEATIGTMDDMYCDLHQDDSWRSMDMENLVCDMREFDEYLPIDGGSSLHQAIQIYALDNDICLDRQQRVHVCSSFRPAYYEYFVHPAMSFLQKTRRVLIMGNGASFFLHEVLKYDIEYVLVLELDQTMMDMAQKHFGVDPHFDDPRVEWWFSDPREVLSLMDDWVSFDLVLADLPDSTLSSMNRDGRDLGDLVHKNGIFVSKNSQMERLSELFAFTSRWAYKLTPGCAQVLTWSSHSVDFAYAPVVDHNIDTVLYQASLMKENRFQLLHDFDRNIGESDLEERAVQDAVSLGMIQILEFVNATANLEETIYSSLHEHGLQILSTMTLSTSLVWRTTDGYIVSRQSGPYIGMDIHLAKNTSKVSALAATIADKLGSVQSSYRLVTNGIQMSQKHATAKKTSKSNEVTPSSMAGDASIVGDILSAITATMLPSPKHALVICETAHDCLSGSVMRNLRLVETHFVLEIPSIQQNRTDEVPLESMMVHEQQLQNWIQKTLIDTEIYIDSIFLDGSLSLRSLQLLDALLNIEEQNLEDWISKETLLVVLPTLMHTRKARRFVANQFQLLGETQNIRRKSHRTEFSAKADFVIAGRNATQRMEFSLVAQGRRNASKALEALETTLTDTFRESELQVRIQQLQGGPLKSADLLQAQLFQQSDFNLVAEQDPTSPIGTQALIQIDAKNSGPVILDAFVADVTNALQALSIQLVQQRVVENAMIFDLDRGDLVIVIQHDTAIDLNLHLACTGDQCPMSDLYRFICHLTSWNREWELIFVDVFPRGPGKNLRFSSTPHIRQGLEACAQHNDEDNEDSAFDDVDSNGNVDHEKAQNDNEEQNDDEDEQNDDDEEHDEDEGEQNENKDEQKKDNEEQNDDEDEENNDDEDEENNDDEDEENNDDEDEENNDDEEDSENEGETFA